MNRRNLTIFTSSGCGDCRNYTCYKYSNPFCKNNYTTYIHTFWIKGVCNDFQFTEYAIQIIKDSIENDFYLTLGIQI